MPPWLAESGTFPIAPYLLWLAPLVALTPLLLMRWIGREMAWALLVALATVSLAVVACGLGPLVWHPIKLAAGFASLAALVWSLVAWAATPASPAGDSHAARLASASRVASTAAAAMAAVIFGSIAATRVAQVVLEVWHGTPLIQVRATGFDADGVVMLLATVAASIVVRRAGGGRAALALSYWLSVLAVGWFALLRPVYRPSETGGYDRTEIVLALIVGLSMVFTWFVLLEGIRRNRGRWRASRLEPEALPGASDHWPGVRQSGAVIGIILILLICLQITAPPSRWGIGIRASALIACVCGLAVGASCFALLGRRWSTNLADVALGLTTLAAAALAVSVAPAEHETLGRRFPAVFNAIMIAFSAMSWLWAWLVRVWRQQVDGGRAAWTSAGRLVPVCERFAFLVGCLAVLVGALMAIWPRLRSIDAADGSLGRVAAGVAGHLLLVLVLMWNGRVLGRSSFGVLAVLSVLSLILFITVRAQPLVSTMAPAAGAGCHAGPPVQPLDGAAAGEEPGPLWQPGF